MEGTLLSPACIPRGVASESRGSETHESRLVGATALRRSSRQGRECRYWSRRLVSFLEQTISSSRARERRPDARC